MSNALSVFAAAADAPDADAVVLPEGRVWSWADVAGRIAAVCGRLQDAFGRGPERIAFVADARPATVLTYLALWELGWTAVPLHVRWTESEQSAYLDRLGLQNRLD